MCQRKGLCYHPTHIFSYAAHPPTTANKDISIPLFACLWVTHIVSSSFLSNVSLSLLCSLSHSYFPQSRHMRNLSGRQKWERNSMPFFTSVSSLWCWGLIPFPLCPPLCLMWGIRLTQHSEIYRWWICSQINVELSWQAHGSQRMSL